MSDYWGMPEKIYELSLFQFAEDKLLEKGYSILSEKVEICGGAGALTITAIIEINESMFGLYLHDGAKQRKSRGPPVIKILKLLAEMGTAEELRFFVISHQHDFDSILTPENVNMANIAENDMREIYMYLYNLKIKNLYDNDISNAANVLREQLRKIIHEL